MRNALCIVSVRVLAAGRMLRAASRSESVCRLCSPVVFALGLDFNPRWPALPWGRKNKRYQREAIMVRACLFVAALVSMLATPLCAQTGDFKPVTREMLANPSPGDWLMLNRTYDEQRFSPLKEINRDTVAGLQLAWARGMAAGTNETIPIVYQGVMYVVSPGAGVLALDATNGDLIWDYAREYPKDMTDFIGAPTAARQKGLAIFEDMSFFESPDGFLVALDARTGKVRWETKVQDYKELTQHTSAPLVVEGKVITGRTCETRAGCFIAAHDARTGKEVWKFYNTAAPGQPGGDTWGSVPAEQRVASSWGLPVRTIRSARRFIGRSPIPSPTPGSNVTAAPRVPRRPRPPISIPIPPWRSTSRPGSSNGTTSICPATIGISITSTSERCCAPRSIPILAR